MEVRDLADLGQLTNEEFDGFISFYKSLKELRQLDCEDISVNEYNYPKLVPSAFTYHKKKDRTGGYADDGLCRVCDKDRQYLIIKPDVVPMCYRCYQAVRAYKNCLFDPLRLKNKRKLDVIDCRRAVTYMNTYAKMKLVALAAAGAMLAIDRSAAKK